MTPKVYLKKKRQKEKEAKDTHKGQFQPSFNLRLFNYIYGKHYQLNERTILDSLGWKFH